MASVVQMPSGRFRAFARVKEMKAVQSFDRRDEAEVWANATEKRMRAGRWVAPTVKRQDVRKTVKEGFATYVESEDWLSKAEVTRRVELAKQLPVIKELGSKRLSELSQDDVRNYIAMRRKTRPARVKQSDPDARLSPDQIRLEVAALSAMCNFAISQHWMESNPTRDVKRPTSNRRTARINDELIGQILSHPKVRGDTRAYVFFRLLFSSVCRPGELATAKKDWYRRNPPQIHIPRTKNEDERAIIIPNSIALSFERYIDSDDTNSPYIFTTAARKKGTWKPFNYASIWAVVARDLNLKEMGIVPHVARHEGVSRLFERTTLSDGQIAAVSGHRTAQALWRYKHLRAEHSRGVLNALDSLIHNAVDAAISPGKHTSRELAPGEMLVPINPPLERRINPKKMQQELKARQEFERRHGAVYFHENPARKVERENRLQPDDGTSTAPNKPLTLEQFEELRAALVPRTESDGD